VKTLPVICVQRWNKSSVAFRLNFPWAYCGNL